jgi:hypothetical protein
LGSFPGRCPWLANPKKLDKNKKFMLWPAGLLQQFGMGLLKEKGAELKG